MNKPLARKSNIVVQELKNETLVYDLKINKAFCLNETSALVWSLCDGNRTASEISGEMSVSLEALVSEELVWIALDQLSKGGLLDGEIEQRFMGLSRREVIRKVGFASVVALPMISSLIAPTAGMAQSGGGGALAACTGVNTQGSCNPGFICRATVTPFVPAGGTPTGMNQCCVNNPGVTLSTVSGGTFCASMPCNIWTNCDGSPITAAPTPNPACGSINTCVT